MDPPKLPGDFARIRGRGLGNGIEATLKSLEVLDKR